MRRASERRPEEYCADALRQRCTALKTSGNDEIFVGRQTANAIFALRLGGRAQGSA